MDNEDSDATSTGNTTSINECVLCGKDLEKKIDLPLTLPSDILCCSCAMKASNLSSQVISRISRIHENSQLLIEKLITSSMVLQETKKKSLTRVKDFKSIEKFKSKTLLAQRDLKDSLSFLSQQFKEKEKLSLQLNEKQVLLSQLYRRKSELEKTLQKEEKPDLNSKLLEENSELLEKIRDFDIENLTFDRDLYECLLVLKRQVKSTRPDRLFVREDLENLSEIQSLIEAEIQTTKRQLSELTFSNKL